MAGKKCCGAPRPEAKPKPKAKKAPKAALDELPKR